MSDQPHIEQDEEPADEHLTQIVSYLDGELEDTQMNEVEQALLQDAALRTEADALSRTWALLDALDEVPASRQFTQDTLATIAADAVSQEQQAGTPMLVLVHRLFTRYQVMPWFVVGVLGAAIGGLLNNSFASRAADDPERQTLETAVKNIDLLQKIELYDLVPDASALKTVQPGHGYRPGAKESAQ